MKRLFAIAIPMLLLLGCATENEPSFELNVSASPSEAGSISPSNGSFNKNEEVTLTATPIEGWQFVRWEGDWSGTINPAALRMTRHYTIIGVFERRNYTLTVTVDGDGTVSERVVSAKTTDYPFQTIVELTPLAAEGWVFKEWSGDLTGSQSPTRITVTSAKSVIAKFERKNYALSVTVEGQGTVTETIIPQKSTEYPFQTVVQLTPAPSEGWRFVEWTGDLTGTDAPKTITVDRPKNVVAKFERRNYALSVTVDGQGTVTESVVMAKSTDYPFETIVELTPVPAIGWAFKEWGGDLSGSQSPARITLIGPKSVVARFMTSPTVSSVSVSNLSASAVSISGNVTSDGGNSVTSRGICYATTENPVLSGSCVASGLGTGLFSADLTGLTAGTVYFARAYATNSIGTAYGNQISFTTWTTPIVETGSISNISSTSAFVVGNATADGGSTITSRGICYSTAQNPTTSGTCVDSGTGTGSYSATLSSLTPGTTYYVRAYATNSVGTSYGGQSSFTTLRLPVVNTGPVTGITSTGATVAGNVSSDGGGTVTSRGICYSTNQNPTTANTCIASGSGTGSFSSTLINLLSAQTYYARAYATNSVGTSYGTQATFKTLTAPVVDIDGNVYPTIQIGTQLWMQTNLKTTRYRDGTAIPSANDNTQWAALTTGAWAIYDNTSENNTTYGKIYNGYAVNNSRNICPSGWHVPSDAEWTVLYNFLSTDVGHKMKSTSGWSNNGNGSNSSGFTALPGGTRSEDGTFNYITRFGHFWSSTPSNSSSNHYRLLLNNDRDLVRFSAILARGFSVRCIRD